MLRAEVTARFGVTWTDIEKDQADIAGVPAELLDVFSKRAAQVDAAYETKLAEFWHREGRDPTPKERGALGREAAADTRNRKTRTAPADLRTVWQSGAATVGATADTLTADLRDAEQRHRRAEDDLADNGLLHRRIGRHAVADTGDQVATARTALDELTHRAHPLLDQRNQVRHEHDRLRREQRRDQQFGRSLDRYHDQLGTARQQLDALDTWREWATGKNHSPDALVNAARQLERTGGDHARLGRPLAAWIDQHDLAPRRPATPQRHIEPQLRPEPPGLDIGF